MLLALFQHCPACLLQCCKSCVFLKDTLLALPFSFDSVSKYWSPIQSCKWQNILWWFSVRFTSVWGCSLDETGIISMTNSPVCVCFHYRNIHQEHDIIQGDTKTRRTRDNERAARQDRCFLIKTWGCISLRAVGRFTKDIPKVKTSTCQMHSCRTLAKWRQTHRHRIRHCHPPPKLMTTP